MPTTTRPRDHPYRANGIRTRPGGPEGCQHCNLPKGNPVHVEVENPISDVDARIVGERHEEGL